MRNKTTIFGAGALAATLLLGWGTASAAHISQAGIEGCQSFITEPVSGLVDETNATWFGGRNNADGDNAIRATLISKLDDANTKLSEAIFYLTVSKVEDAESKTADAGSKLVMYQSKVDSLLNDGPKKKIEAADQAYLSAEAQIAINCVADLLIHQ